MQVNRLRERFQNGRAAIGTFVNMSMPDVLEVLGWAGLDFAVIDTEHAPISLQSVGNLIRAAEISNLAPIVRVPSASAQNIFQALDAAALGVQVPQVRDAQDATLVVRAARYNPLGLRGLAPLRSCKYGMALDDDYFRAANKAVLIVVQIETPEALENLEAIARVEGIDVMFVGPMDLSVALGVQGKTKHPGVEAATQRIIDKARAAGKVAGIAVGTTEEALQCIDQGFQYITVGSDISFISAHALQLAQIIHEHCT